MEIHTMFIDQDILPNLKYRFSSFSVKIPAVFFVATDKITLNFAWKYKGAIVLVTYYSITSIPKRGDLKNKHLLSYSFCGLDI